MQVQYSLFQFLRVCEIPWQYVSLRGAAYIAVTWSSQYKCWLEDIDLWKYKDSFCCMGQPAQNSQEGGE